MSPTSSHGGNIAGALKLLPYWAELGVKALIVNPLYYTLPSSYHGYHPIHFMAVNPRLGTLDDFREFVAEAHRLGMAVVLDVVLNHIAPAAEYVGGYLPELIDGQLRRKDIKRWRTRIGPAELSGDDAYFRHGSIMNYEDAGNGDFGGGLHKLRTDLLRVIKALIGITKWWMLETDVDGLRIDTYPFISPRFWRLFFPSIRAFAALLGKSNFLLLGEIFHGDAGVIAREFRPGRLDAAYGYPLYFGMMSVLHGLAPTAELVRRYAEIIDRVGPDGVHQFLNFFSNLDKPRFLSGKPLRALEAALAVRFGNSYSEMSRHMEALEQTNRIHPALDIGDAHIRHADDGAGLYAVSLMTESEEVIVASNNKESDSRTEDIWVDARIPAGTIFSDELDPSFEAAVYAVAGGGKKIRITVAPHGVRLMSRHDMPTDALMDALTSHFKENAELALHYHDLIAAASSKHPVLGAGNGNWHIRISDTGRGILSAGFAQGNTEVVVVVNSSDRDQSFTTLVDANLNGPGAELYDNLEPSYVTTSRAQASGGAEIEVSIPAGGARLLSRRFIPRSALKVALAYVMFMPGIPYILAGEEQGLEGVRPRPGVNMGLDGHRPDLFPDGLFQSQNSTGDNFDPKSPMFLHTQAFAQARANHRALIDGAMYDRYSDPNGPGGYAFSRIVSGHNGSPGEEVVVALNTSDVPQDFRMYVDAGQTPAGTVLVDEFDPSYETTAYALPDGGVQIRVELPSHGVRLLVARPK